MRIALSALEHYAYCPRQAALIHVDGTWTDDVRTILGDDVHHVVHKPRPTLPAPPVGVRRLTGVPVWSSRLDVYGICDVVETTASGPATPIEHKVGAYRPRGAADVQVAALALCLNEMLDQQASVAYIYSHTDRRRHEVQLTSALLGMTEEIIAALHELVLAERIPAPVNDRRCARCSLQATCLPDLANVTRPLIDLMTPKALGGWDA